MHGERAKFQAVLIQRGGVSGSSGRSEKPQKFQSILSFGLAGGIMRALKLHADERRYEAEERQMEADVFQRLEKMAEAEFENARRMDPDHREPTRHKRCVKDDPPPDVEKKDKKKMKSMQDDASDVEEKLFKAKNRRPSVQAKELFWNRFVAHIRD